MHQVPRLVGDLAGRGRRGLGEHQLDELQLESGDLLGRVAGRHLGQRIVGGLTPHARGHDEPVAQCGGVHRHEAIFTHVSELIHTCYRIGDIDRSVAFYEKLGFEETGRFPIRDEAINVFMGLPGDGARLELTYNHGVDSYEMGTGYNHIAVTVSDLDGTLSGWPSRASSPRSRPTACARAAADCASYATRTVTGSS